jgi:hypothetical protein
LATRGPGAWREKKRRTMIDELPDNFIGYEALAT